MANKPKNPQKEKFSGKSVFDSWEIPKIPKEYNIGIIVGASGTGKTTLLNELGDTTLPVWKKDKAIVSHFENPSIAIDRLSGVGFNSIPSWCKPYHVLSTGEKFRADLAIKLKDNTVIDEFTSVVDRNVAKSTSVAVSKYIRNSNIKNVIFASCHEDILNWLEPDWIFNTNNGKLLVGRYLRRPKIVTFVYKCRHNLWEMFKGHHYLSSKLNKASRCFVGIWNNEIVVFTSAIRFPNGNFDNAWREHRTVILPDYQGMGIGTRFSDCVAQLFIDDGFRYFSRTAHIRMGEYRNKSNLWKPTTKNKIIRKDIKSTNNGTFNNWYVDTRLCYSHEYIGQ